MAADPSVAVGGEAARTPRYCQTASQKAAGSSITTLEGVDPAEVEALLADDTVLVSQADLQITKTDAVVSAIAGDSVTYTLYVSNAGPSDAANVVVTDTWPVGFSRGVVTPSQGSCDTTNPDDWARISGRKGERIINVRTLMTGISRKERSIENITSGQYL